MKDYAEKARMVDIAMRHMGKPCIGDGCDIDKHCKRHTRTASLVFRVTSIARKYDAIVTAHEHKRNSCDV